MSKGHHTLAVTASFVLRSGAQCLVSHTDYPFYRGFYLRIRIAVNPLFWATYLAAARNTAVNDKASPPRSYVG
jgi:hypothetical protein